jgi:hypothetical protein
MGENCRLFFFLEFADFGGDVVNDGCGHDQRSLFFRWRRNNPRFQFTPIVSVRLGGIAAER